MLYLRLYQTENSKPMLSAPRTERIEISEERVQIAISRLTGIFNDQAIPPADGELTSHTSYLFQEGVVEHYPADKIPVQTDASIRLITENPTDLDSLDYKLFY